MIDGFLGTRASLYPDIVVVSLFLVLPAFIYGAYLAKQGKTKAHAAIMSLVFGVLFLVVLGFIYWNQALNTSHPPIKDSPLYKSFYIPFTIFHIVIAISSLILGSFQVLTAWFWREPKADGELCFKSSKHRKIHKVGGWIALLLFTLVAVTGCVIYYFRYVYVP